MHREVPPLYSKVRQLARGLILLATGSGLLSTILLCFLVAASVSASSVTYTYDELGRLKIASYDNGTTTTYSLDAAGNRKNVATSTDTTTPAQPSGLAGVAVSKSQINLSWSQVLDTTGSTLVGYYVFRDGVQLVNTAPPSPTPTFQDVGLAEYTSHTYTVAAFDNASPSNVSLQSAATPSIRTLDQSAPSPTPVLAAPIAVSASQINLSWSASTDSGTGLAGYQVFRDGTGLTPVGPAVTTFSDTGLAEYSSHTYYVQAFDGASPRNNATSATTAPIRTFDVTAPSPAPAITSATAVSASQINLSWSGSTDSGTGLAGYQVFRDGTGLTPVGPAVTTFSDSGLAEYSSHTYYVQAFDGASPRNNATSATTAPIRTFDVTAPSPTPVMATPMAVSKSQINLSWSASTDSGTGLQGYQVFRDGAGLTAVGPGVTTFQDTGLGEYTSHTYYVQAFDGASPRNNATSATTASIFTLDQTPPILQPPLSATATSQSTIGLIWQQSPGDPTPGAGFAGYTVYRNGVAISGLLPIATVTFNDTGLAPATTYNYTLIATDRASPPNSSSLTASATTPSNIPNTPPGTPSPSGIVTTATWTETWSASSGPVAYYILNKTGGTGPQNFTVNAPATSSAQGGGNGITYQYQVQACNSSGQCSAFGTPAFVTRCNGGVCP